MQLAVRWTPPAHGRIGRMTEDGAAAEHYNVPAYYREVNRDARRAYAGRTLRVGDPAPRFRLPTVDDGVADLDELRHEADVVLVFGCHSAPPCRQELPRIDAIAEADHPGVRLVLVYTREIHPNEQLAYGRFPHHRTLEDKTAAARRLRDELGLRMTVAVDDLAGTTHRAYGGLPFSAVVVGRDGILVHREEWASPEQLTGVLTNLRRADQARAAGQALRVSLSETLWSMERLPRKD
jgi:Iodothyronine deiodinase